MVYCLCFFKHLVKRGSVKVLIVHPHMALLGGAETVVQYLCMHLKQKGVQADVLTLSLSDDVRDSMPGIRFILPDTQIPYEIKSQSLLKSFKILTEAKTVRSLLGKVMDDYDVINVHNFPCTWGLKKTRKPVIWLCNEPPAFWGNPNPGLAVRAIFKTGSAVDRILVNRYVHKIIVADTFNRERVHRLYGRDSNIVYYGIDHGFFQQAGHPEKISARYDLDGKFVVTQVGMITPAKNQLATLQALHELGDTIPDIRVVFAGFEIQGYRKILDDFIQEKNLQDNVVFTGPLPREDIRDLYKVSAVACSPTIEQGGWLSPFEALCCNAPIVLSERISCSEIVRNHDLGQVTNDFAKSIKQIYQTPESFKKQAVAGNNWVRENLTWERFGDNFLSIFEQSC